MRHKFNVGDMVKIKSPYYISNGCIGIISAVSYFTIDEETQYEVHILETDTNICVNESDLVKIPEKGYSPTTQQIKNDINSIFGLPMTILINAKQEAYIDQDIRRTQEMMDAVGKMIHEKEERKMFMTPKKIMRNGPATIVFWEDGTKTVVKKMPGDKDDIYAAFCAAFAKKHFGSNEKVKTMVRSLTQPSEEDIERATEKFLQKHYRAFCNGYRVAVSKSDFKCDEHSFEKVLKSLNNKGFITKKNFVCSDGRWLVTRDDTKYIEWHLKKHYFNTEITITLGYTNGDPYRMEKIAENLVKDGYAIACSYRTNYTNPISTYIDEIKVYKK